MHRSETAHGGRGHWVGCVTILLLLLGASAAYADRPTIDGQGDEDAINLTAREAHEAAQAANATAPAVRLVEYRHADLCQVAGVLTTPLNGPCPPASGVIDIPGCDGLTPVQPLWRRTRSTPADPWTAWTFVIGWSCPQDVLPAFTAADFRRLPLAPPTIHIQPDTGRVLVNLPVVTMTDATPQLLATDLLGYPIEVDATPTSYSWDYGDGSPPLVTTSPGHPYPNHDVSHAYGRAGDYRITLTVTYSGRYRFAGTTRWLSVAGTANTAATSPPITAEPAPSRLVATDCTRQPKPSGC